MKHNVQGTQNTRDTRWSEQLSAYLDGELTPAEARTLKEQIAEQPDLRQELEEMRMTREVMRSVPLQTPPRNYLLTPSMVAADKPSQVRAPRSRRMPLLLLRLATSLTAIAFVITAGLGYIQNTARPATQLTREMSQEATSLERVESTVPVEMERETKEEAETFAATQATPPDPDATLSPQEEMALSEVPEGSQEGLGGGAAPMPEATARDELDTEQANGDIAVASDDTGEEAAAEEEAIAPQEQEDELLPISPDEPEVAAPDPSEIQGEREAFPPPGLSAVLGGLTLILAVITFWFSRQG
ncbi:MAG: anti-sigma factor family protein [Anaerolineales bacterium]